jgi:hypothetical protein
MTGHPDNRLALMGIRCAAKCCKRPKPGTAGLSRRPPAFEDFAPTLVRTFSTAVPSKLARRGSSFRALHVPFRALRLPTCPCDSRHRTLRPAIARPGAPSLGFPALFATSAGGIHTRTGIPVPVLRSVHGVSHAHDGLRHHRPCGFVSPRYRVQGSPFRGLSPAWSTNRFPGPPALLPLDAAFSGFDAGPNAAPPTSGLCSPDGCGGRR